LSVSDERGSVLLGLFVNFMAEGMEAKQVVELLANNTNDHGGILGKKVEMIYEDDRGNPRHAEQQPNGLPGRAPSPSSAPAPLRSPKPRSRFSIKT
jgi:hypothetical protein